MSRKSFYLKVKVPEDMSNATASRRVARAILKENAINKRDQATKQCRINLTKYLTGKSLSALQSFYDEWIEWFNYGDIISIRPGDVLPFDKMRGVAELVEAVMGSDPLVGKGGLQDFLMGKHIS